MTKVTVVLPDGTSAEFANVTSHWDAGSNVLRLIHEWDGSVCNSPREHMRMWITEPEESGPVVTA